MTTNIKTGVQVDGKLKQTFQKMSSSGGDRFIKATVNSGAGLIELESVHPSSSTWEVDLDQVPPVCEDKTPCFILYRTDNKGDNGNYSWYIFSFVPDDAIAKRKMLFSATKNTLSSELGPSNFLDVVHGTFKAEFSASGFKDHLAQKNSPVPLSEQELQRKEEREQEVNTVIELMQTPQQSSSSAGQSNVLFPINDQVPEALSCLQTGEFNYVRLTIDQKKEEICLDEACVVDVNSLKDKVPLTDCAFHFYKWNHAHEGKNIDSIVFVFSTPDGSNGHKPAPVRSRTLYASSKANVLNNCGFPVDLKLEIGNGSELSQNELQLSLHPPQATEATTFKKPTGPKKAVKK